jgi:hypothetical protein
MCRARTRGARALVGVETQLDAADEAAASSHFAAREADLNALQEACDRRGREADARVAEAHGRVKEVEDDLAQLEVAAMRADQALARAKAKWGEAVQR